MNSQTHHAYRHDIDGLRAIAVVAVVGYHSGLPFMTGGFIGVDVFFVISGFLITGLLDKEAASTGKIHLGAFYARRVRRLLPALVCAILGTLVLGYLWLVPWGEQQRLARSALATAGFASNFYFWLSAESYFAAPVEHEPLLHTWSLAVEEQFYFAWPIVLLATHAKAVRMKRNPRSVLAVVLTFLFAASLVACVWLTPRIPAAAFYLVPFRAWEFALGGLLSLATWRPRGGIAAALGGAGLLAIALSSVVFGPQTVFPGWTALAPTLGTVAVIAARGDAWTTQWLSAAPMRHIGQWSYSWYLWHWPLIAIGRATRLSGPEPLQDGALALVALGLAVLSYRVIETPIRVRRPGPFGGQRSTLLSGVALSLAIVAGAAALGLHARQALRTVEPFRSVSRALAEGVELLSPCDGSARVPCQSKTWGRGPGILLWGDSHARRLWPLVEGSGAAIARTASSCPPLLGGITPSNHAGEPGWACRDFNEQVIREIRKWHHDGSLSGVALAARWPYYTGTPTPAGRAPGGLYPRDQSFESLHHGLAATLDALSEAGVRVLVVAPLPEQRVDVPACLLRRASDECKVLRQVAEDYRAPALRLLRSEIARHPAALLLDTFDVLCPRTRCEVEKAGLPLYRDADHVTPEALRLLSPRFAPAIEWLKGGAASWLPTDPPGAVSTTSDSLRLTDQDRYRRISRR